MVLVLHGIPAADQKIQNRKNQLMKSPDSLHSISKLLRGYIGKLVLRFNILSMKKRRAVQNCLPCIFFNDIPYGNEP